MESMFLVEHIFLHFIDTPQVPEILLTDRLISSIFSLSHMPNDAFQEIHIQMSSLTYKNTYFVSVKSV